MKKHLRVAIAQLNFFLADIRCNSAKIVEYATKARDDLDADVVVFPEMALTGYLVDDLLTREDFHEGVRKAVSCLLEEVRGIYVIFGYPEKFKEECYNSALTIYNGNVVSNYRKQKLPNYGVFDENRYFIPGSSLELISINEIKIATLICEDLWSYELVSRVKKLKPDLVISVNASPFDREKLSKRRQLMSCNVRELKTPIIYVNCVGAQDELVFDGGSMVFDTNCIAKCMPFFEENLDFIDLESATSDSDPKTKKKVVCLQRSKFKESFVPSQEALIYEALKLGVRDYVEKNSISKVIIGLSGGIDSALTLAIAVDALGKQRVHAVSMPSRFTKEMSVEDAMLQSKLLGVKFSVISIEDIFSSFLTNLSDVFDFEFKDLTKENLQARCRGSLLMAISNQENSIVLSTSNKSEIAVGYSTLYGDMIGGFCVLKDVFKTMVYKLVEYRNKISRVIPERVAHLQRSYLKISWTGIFCTSIKVQNKVVFSVRLKDPY